jgi:hypothetical protein
VVVLEQKAKGGKQMKRELNAETRRAQRRERQREKHG